MQNLVRWMDENGVAEEYNVPQGSLVVLAVTPHNENVPWYEYQWMLCLSYQKLNHVTRPFALPIPLCDYEVQGIDKEENYFIAMDMDSGYW